MERDITLVFIIRQKRGVVAKYKKVHLPGTKEAFENPDAVNPLEKR